MSSSLWPWPSSVSTKTTPRTHKPNAPSIFFGKVLPLVIGNSAILASANSISMVQSENSPINGVAAAMMSRPMNAIHSNLDTQMTDAKGYITHAHSTVYFNTESETYSSTSPVMFSPQLYLIGGLLAIMALFLALSTQKEKKLTSPARTNTTTPHSPNAARKVRWRLGDSSSDDEPIKAKGEGLHSYYTHSYYNRTRQHTPSYDGCYYGADPQDNKTPSPSTSRRNFGYDFG